MVVGPGDAVKAGGFLTGWKGIAIFITVSTVAVVMAVTGIQANKNTFPRLSRAEAEFSSGDYGLGPLYAPCITNGSFIGQRWVFDLPIPGTDGRTTEVVSLGNSRLLSQLSDGGIETGVRWNNNPEFVCFVICRIALGDDCTYFTYDGLDADSCRFGAPDFPMEDIVPTDPEDFMFVYNATCMQQRRVQLVTPIETARTGLTRPAALVGPGGRPALGNEQEATRLLESLVINLQFLRGQWAGPLPPGNEYVAGGGYPWREPGFTELDEVCGTEAVEGSFATGEHVVVTMATANEVAMLALSFVWWRKAAEQLGRQVLQRSRDELLRSAAFLIRAWEPDAGDVGRIMLGVGDQLNSTAVLEMFADFGSASNALQIGQPDFVFGQPTQVLPMCTFTRTDAPDPATAAHMAAALALSSEALAALSANDGLSPEDMQLVASELYRYSVVSMPFDGSGAASPPFSASASYGAAQLYPLDEDNDLQVFSHQMWAACTLFHATGDVKYWNDTLAIYTRYFSPLEGGETPADSALYTPAANYRNPQWFAMLCMAQSAPEASNIALDELLAVPEHVDPTAESPTNETAAGWRGGQRDQYRQYLRAQLPEAGSRMEVTRQIGNNFVFPWLTLESQLPSDRPGDDPEFGQNDRLRRTSKDNFHYFDLNSADEDVVGTATVVRDSANAAMIKLMYADMPGVDVEQAFLARCMAKQQVDFILGENSGEISLQADFGDDAVQNFWHKDSACPDVATRNSTFLPIFRQNPDFDPNETESILNRVTISTRRCDYLTFFGNLTDPDDYPDYGKYLAEQGLAVPEVLDPVLPNFNPLSGAVAATFDTTGDSGNFIVDQRAVCKDGNIDLSTCPRSSTQTANPMMQVSIDTNAALYAAVVGVIGLPAEFWDRIEECPSAGDRVAAAQTLRDDGLEEDRRAVESDFIAEATADPNRLTIQGPGNGLRVPRLAAAPATAADADDDGDDVREDGGDEADAPDYAADDQPEDDENEPEDDENDEDAADAVSDGR